MIRRIMNFSAIPACILLRCMIPEAAAAEKTNFVLCMTDDQGWGDAGCQGHGLAVGFSSQPGNATTSLPPAGVGSWRRGWDCLGGGFHQVNVSIPRAQATGGKLFARLEVTVTTTP